MQPLLTNTEYYYHGDPAADAAAAGFIIFAIMVTFVLVLALYALQAYLLSRIFRKGGEKEWKAWVPVYNNWVTLELGGQKGWWSVLALLPVVNIVALIFMYLAMYHIGLKLKKEGAFILLAIFLPLVWYAWLAFDSSTWKGKKPAHSAKARQND